MPCRNPALAFPPPPAPAPWGSRPPPPSPPPPQPRDGKEEVLTRFLRPALFLQKLCGKGKILIAINKNLTTSRVEVSSQTPVPGWAQGAALLLLTPRSRHTEPRRPPLLATKLCQKLTFLPTQVCSLPRQASSCPAGAQETFPASSNRLCNQVGLSIPLRSLAVAAPSVQSPGMSWDRLAYLHPCPRETSQHFTDFWRKGGFAAWDVSGGDYASISLLGHLICPLSP